MNYTLWSYENTFETCFIHALQLYKSYPATQSAGYKTAHAHGASAPQLPRRASPSTQTLQGCTQLPPGSPSPGIAISVQVQPALHQECCWFQQGLAGQGFPRCSCEWAAACSMRASPGAEHGGPGCGGDVEVQDSSVLFQQLWAEEISCLWVPRGLQTPDQQQGRQWQILHFNAPKGRENLICMNIHWPLLSACFWSSDHLDLRNTISMI